jgi:hypothetical membrane protein
MMVVRHTERGKGEHLMEVRQIGEGADHVLERRSVIVALAVAGIVGPIIFAVVALIQSLLHPDYSHVALPISALAAWPGGWVQNVNFVVFGLLMIAYAIGLHLGVRPSRAGVIGPALLVLSGVGLMIAGFFPWRDVDGDFIVPVGHLLGALLSFLGAGTGLIVISRRMTGDPRWRSLATYALASGIAIVILFVATFALVIPPDAPLHGWGGLVQRVTIAVWFPCLIVLALRLLRVARAVDASR